MNDKYTCRICGKAWEDSATDDMDKQWSEHRISLKIPPLERKPEDYVHSDSLCGDCQVKESARRETDRVNKNKSVMIAKSGLPLRRLHWDESKGNKAMMDFFHKNSSISLYVADSYGSNKTWCACHAAYEIISEKAKTGCFSIRFWLVADFLAHLAALYGEDCSDAERLVHELKSCDLLIIDDLGKEKLTDRGGEALFRILNHRYENELPTWITSNLNAKELKDKMGERGCAIVRRLHEGYLSWSQWKLTSPEKRNELISRIKVERTSDDEKELILIRECLSQNSRQEEFFLEDDSEDNEL